MFCQNIKISSNCTPFFFQMENYVWIQAISSGLSTHSENDFTAVERSQK